MNNIFTNVLIYRRAPRGNAVQLCSISSSKTCTAALPSPTSTTPTPLPLPTPAYHLLLLLLLQHLLLLLHLPTSFSFFSNPSPPSSKSIAWQPLQPSSQPSFQVPPTINPLLLYSLYQPPKSLLFF